MKRLISLLLCAVLLPVLSLAARAAEEPVADKEDELARITALVKETLAVDDDYTQFRGDYNDGPRPGWYLNWSDDARELSVTSDAAGVVMEVYRWENSGRSGAYGFNAAFPAVTEASARAEAEEWLERLGAEGESARIDSHTVTLAKDGEHSFRGRILINGLESPATFEIRIGPDGLAGYSRSDAYRGYVGEFPPAEPETGEKTAAELLAAAVELELYYVSDGSGEARLRYVPVGPYTVVDAQSGEAVDMDALYAAVGGSPSNGEEIAMESAAADMGAGRGLTEVELSSIAQYADVLSREKIDEVLQGIPRLGLADFELARCSYAMAREGDAVTANLTYTAEMGTDRLFGYSREAYEDYMSWNDRAVVYKYITVDAATGAVKSVSTSYPLWGGRPGDARSSWEQAEEFLTACEPVRFGESRLCDLAATSEMEGYVYARAHDGYFFPENYLQVVLNEATGTVDEFRFEWDEDVGFASAEGILDEAAAVEAYASALTVTLGYAAWPEGIDYDDPVLMRYISWGYTWVESLRLGYYYSGTDRVSGVDALTGEAVTEELFGGLRYKDIEDEPGREAIEALGAAGIGFSGGHFRPDAALTVKEAVTLLIQAEGYDAGAWEDDALRREALWQGFMDAADWQPEQGLSRMAFIRMILTASPYGAATELRDVWAGEYPGVAEEDVGLAAIALALGMTTEDGPDWNEDCTRADAAELLYGFMTRESA